MIKRYYNQFRWFLKHYKYYYMAGIPLIILTYLLDLQPPKIVGRVADNLVAGNLTLPELTHEMLLLVVIVLISYVAGVGWGYCLYRATDDITYLSHSRIFDRLLRQGPAFYARNTTGSIMGKATNDVSSLGEFAGYGLMAIFDATVWPIAIYVMMFRISWRLTLFASIPLPFLVLFSQRIGIKLYHRYEAAQQAFDHMNEAVLEGVSGVRVVRAYNQENAETNRFQQDADNLFNANMRAVRLTQLYTPVTKMLPGLSFLIALGLGLFEMKHGRVTTGNLITFMFYLNMLSWPMISIGEFINVGQMGSASMTRIDELLDQPLDIDDTKLTAPMPEDKTLAMRGFSFTYPDDDRLALDDITFTLKDGQTMGLVGPVGSGKTTLLKQFLHFYPLPKDKVFVNGTDLATIQRDQLREAIAYVPQESYLFSKSVKENILLGASDEALADGHAERCLEQVLDWADIRKDLPQLENGIESQVGEKGLALSGGQKQRICIARALMKDSDILILDDCLSAVDAITEEHILGALKEARRDRTTLIAAHRLSAVHDADLIVVLDEGRIIDSGSHAELIGKSGWYRDQYERQQLTGGEVDHD